LYSISNIESNVANVESGRSKMGKKFSPPTRPQLHEVTNSIEVSPQQYPLIEQHNSDAIEEKDQEVTEEEG
jgi:hypothetical protein